MPNDTTESLTWTSVSRVPSRRRTDTFTARAISLAVYSTESKPTLTAREVIIMMIIMMLERIYNFAMQASTSYRYPLCFPLSKYCIAKKISWVKIFVILQILMCEPL